MTGCRLCAGPAETFISFGRMPIANGFLAENELEDEYFFDLAAAFCERCAMPQLVDAVAPGRMFHERYPFFTSSSRAMSEHFGAFARDVRGRWLEGDDSLVIEIGSNDGTLLRYFADAGIRHLGVDPSANVAAAARDRGVRSLVGFFDADAAARILREEGAADVVLAANCFCHVQDLHALAEDIGRILKARGVIVFEDPYVGDILEQGAYDQIYDEHLYYFSLAGVSRWLEAHGFEVIDANPQPVHGGSMRFTAARRGIHAVDGSVEALRREEARRNLGRAETFLAFRRRVERSRDDLVGLLRRARLDGNRVAGYAATSKSTTVLNYCGITSELVEYISDTTPIKQGKLSPGMHIPVKSHAHFAASHPDMAVLFAWNHAREIMANERDFAAGGGRWIAYVPEVGLLA
jgi:methylation protein EvaC